MNRLFEKFGHQILLFYDKILDRMKVFISFACPLMFKIVVSCAIARADILITIINDVFFVNQFKFSQTGFS